MPNWLGLLRWSMAVNDGTAPSQFSAMTEADKSWLETVMNEVVRSDPQRMDEVMSKVNELLIEGGGVASDEDEDALLVDLEDLRDIVEQVDMAQVFAKVGGCEILLRVGEHSGLPTSVRALAVAIIGTVSQNNLTVQDALYGQGIVQRLASLLRTSAEQKLLLVAKKAFFALSATVRGHAASEEHFALHELHGVAVAVLAEPVLRSKVYFLASALVESDTCSEVRVAAVARALLLSLLGLSAGAEPPEGEAESLEFGMVLLRDLLHTKVGQQLLLVARAHGASRRGADVDDAPSEDESAATPVAAVATSLADLQQEPLDQRFNRALQRWEQSLAAIASAGDAEGDRGVLVQQWQALREVLFDDSGRRRAAAPPIRYPRNSGGPGATTAPVPVAGQPQPSGAEEVLLIAPPPLQAAPRAP